MTMYVWLCMVMYVCIFLAQYTTIHVVHKEILDLPSPEEREECINICT